MNRKPRKKVVPSETDEQKMTIAEKVAIKKKTRKAKPKTPPPPETVGENMPDGTYVSEEEDKSQVVLKYLGKVRNPMTAIRAFCVQCCGGYLGEISKCQNGRENAKPGEPWCPLHEFRNGDNPYHRRTSKSKSDEEVS